MSRVRGIEELKQSGKRRFGRRVLGKREEFREWFSQLVSEGVKPPTYVGSQKPSSAETVFRLALTLLTALLTSIPYMTRGEFTAFYIALAIAALFGGVLEFLNFIRAEGIKELEKLKGFFADLLKNPAVEKWCSPSELIPVCCVLKSGVYVVVELEYGIIPRVLFLKPVAYVKVARGKPVVKVKWVRVNGKGKLREVGVKFKKGVATVTFPHVEFKNTLYTARAYAVEVKAEKPDKLSPDKLAEFAEWLEALGES